LEAAVALDRLTQLDALERLPGADRAAVIAELGREVLQAEAATALPDDARRRLVVALLGAVESGDGASRDRLVIGAALAALGDPRLRAPSDPSYWARVESDEGPFLLGRHMVTNREYRAFVDAGGYDRPDLWDEQGLAWLNATKLTWPALAARPDAGDFVVDNQPVVGVTWHEAMAYARWAAARLPTFEERLAVVRGGEKRPYPWGSPFGEGNANTSEEVLNRPCAVGLYVRDRSPEGVYDLAGNVAEWCGDGVSDQKWVHPGAWDQPSMAAWAKARVLQAPAEWSAALGFRVARDLG
jgi:formylglycine-generating enzyme required for sulfatase activity